MLEFIRKRTKSLYVAIIFAALSVVFIVWGIGPTGNGGVESAVATVDGEAITLREYTDLYRRQVDYYRNIFKDRFTPEFEKTLNLKGTAVDILVNRALAVKEGESMGVEATEEEVRNAIISVPAFQKDGAFDRDTYFNALKAERIKPADFEETVRRDIVTSRVREGVVKDVAATDEEVRDFFLKDNRLVNLSYLHVGPARYAASQTVSDDEAMAYLQEHSMDFI